VLERKRMEDSRCTPFNLYQVLNLIKKKEKQSVYSCVPIACLLARDLFVLETNPFYGV
jgi:hypothetical protein